MVRLLHREWFRRLWVVQEVLLNSSIVARCGLSQVPWGVFTRLAQELDAQAFLLPFLTIDGRVAPGLHMAGSLLRFEASEDTQNVLSLVYRFSKQRVTDPRDRLYAVFSLVNNPRDVSMTPDHSLDTCGLYTLFTRKCIESSSSLDILHHVEMGDMEAPNDLPSWVPDWRDSPHARSFGTEYISRQIFSASQAELATIRFGLAYEILLFRGRHVGSIKSGSILFLADLYQSMHLRSMTESLHERELRL